MNLIKKIETLIRKLKESMGFWHRNYGFTNSGRTNADFVFGGETGILPDILQHNGQWDMYLPAYEYQKVHFETMACVSFSALNCLEIYLKRKYGETWDFSDRYTSKMSGTTPQGNSMWKVAESIRKNDGVLSWLFYGNEGKYWNEWYRDIDQSLINLARTNLGQLKIQYEWVEPSTTNNLREALKYGPLQLAIYAYGKKVNGVYQKVDGMSANHCVTLYGWDENGNWKIFDHYQGNEKRLLAPDYVINFALRYDITR